MGTNRTKAFEINNGLLFEDGVHLISGEDSPVSISVSFPTRYFRNNGEQWYHDGVSSWVLVTTSGFDVDTVLVDQFFDVISDQNGNVLTGL